MQPVQQTTMQPVQQTTIANGGVHQTQSYGPVNVQQQQQLQMRQYGVMQQPQQQQQQQVVVSGHPQQQQQQQQQVAVGGHPQMMAHQQMQEYQQGQGQGQSGQRYNSYPVYGVQTQGQSRYSTSNSSAQTTPLKQRQIENGVSPEDDERIVEISRTELPNREYKSAQLRRSKSDYSYTDSPKSVAAQEASASATTNGSLNPDAKDFVPSSNQNNQRLTTYRRYGSGSQSYRQYRDRNMRGRGGYGRRNYRSNSYPARDSEMKMWAIDPHQMARKRVQECVNKVRDRLDTFATQHQLDAFYPDDQDTNDYFQDLTNLSTSLLEEINQIIATPTRN
eukprot:TRINITY_DN6763_c0_g1_i1.p1 TRINITY_DN6763_c0_g1~~TRINITY_DN6763_c0_g1_i1.p1  ORF type:complete len:386 (+),score=36.14 TRINITY_DN6763_c0_g1_i1:157-1158(+)